MAHVLSARLDGWLCCYPTNKLKPANHTHLLLSVRSKQDVFFRRLLSCGVVLAGYGIGAGAASPVVLRCGRLLLTKFL